MSFAEKIIVATEMRNPCWINFEQLEQIKQLTKDLENPVFNIHTCKYTRERDKKLITIIEWEDILDICIM